MDIYAYGNVDALHGIFNAVAMIMNTGDFADMIRVAVVIGFAVVATLAALPGNLAKSWNWFLTVTVLVSVMLVPKTTVTIVDKLGFQAPVAVANVPWSLALMAQIKTSIGSTLTQMFETAFQTIPSANVSLPAELSYLEHGMMFGSRLVKVSRDAEPQSLYLRGDLLNFIRSCIFPEQGRSALPNAMEESTDLQALFASMTNAGLSAAYHDSAAGWVLVTAPCTVVWTKLQAGLNAAGAEAVVRAAASTLPELYKINPGLAVAKLEQAMPAIYNKAALASASATASQISVQNILINATADASALYGASLNDPSVIMYASMRSQAVQQMNSGNLVQGRIAEEALPIVRNITEGLLYASFPLLCILLVASEGKALGALFKSYVFVLLWVELWPPMFAVVNYLQTLAAAKELASAGYLGAGASGLALGTAGGIFSTSVSTLATSAWMVTFVPVLAAAVLFGFDKIMSITGATAGGTRAAQNEASAAAKGNAQFGNMSFDQQQLAGYRSDPAMYTQEALGGVEFGNVMGGAKIARFRQAEGLATVEDVTSVTRGMSQEAATSTALAQRSGKAAEASIDSAFTAARGAMKDFSQSASKTLGFDVSKVRSDGLLQSEADETAQRIATLFRIEDASQVSKVLTASLGADARGSNASGKLQTIAGAISQVMGAQAGAKGESVDREGLAKEISAASDQLHKQGMQRKQEVVDAFRSNEAFESVRRSNRSATDRVEASSREAVSFRQTEQAELARSEQLSAKVEAAERFARSSTARFSNELDQFARSRHGVSIHSGVAKTAHWQQIVRDFIAAGSLRTDGDGGRSEWIAPDLGAGPNIVDTSPARSLATGGRAGLQARFDGAVPGGGRSEVETQGVAFRAREAGRARMLGVDPSSAVADGGLSGRVGAAQASGTATIAAEGARQKSAEGAAQLDYDKRASKLSGYHAPVSTGSDGTNRNKALDGATGADGGARRVFNEEASTESARRADEASRRARQPRAEIPK